MSLRRSWRFKFTGQQIHTVLLKRIDHHTARLSCWMNKPHDAMNRRARIEYHRWRTEWFKQWLDLFSREGGQVFDLDIEDAEFFGIVSHSPQ